MEQDDEDLRFLAQYIYENVFLHYTEKQWGKDPSRINGAVTARVPVYLSRDDRYFQNTYQGIPLVGYTAMIQKMLDRPNITVKLSTDAKGYDFSQYDEVFFLGRIGDYRYYDMDKAVKRALDLYRELNPEG